MKIATLIPFRFWLFVVAMGFLTYHLPAEIRTANLAPLFYVWGVIFLTIGVVFSFRRM